MLRICAKQSFHLRRQATTSLTKTSCRPPQRVYSNAVWASSASSSSMYWQAPLVGYIVGCTWYTVVPTAQCEAGVVTPTMTLDKPTSNTDDQTVSHQIRRALRMVRRILKLMVALTPVAALYPIQYLFPTRISDDTMDAQDALLAPTGLPDGPAGWYYKLCLYCVEWSGAAAIKMMQWAGSRPDMFGREFCAVFSQLQDDTTPHAWKYTERAMRRAYGEDWQDRIQLHEILGSGCIAQVYKGNVLDKDGKGQEVAIKAMHPNVEEDIEADLDLMRLGVKIIDNLPFHLFQTMKWLNFPGMVEEIAEMLQIQLDMRQEAIHLVQFNENFKDDEIVVFPKLIEGYEPSKEVVIMTFCPGIPVLQFARENQLDRELLTKMCAGAIKAVCQMIFLDNFVHGDLHPGNVLVSPDHKFVCLDVGIVKEFNETDHTLISDVLAAFIRKDGAKAGRLMMDDSDKRLEASNDRAVNQQAYIDKIEALTIKACGSPHFMEHLGFYISYICECAAKHHVMLNQSFISAALAVKVQEGIALALDPSVQIWKIAVPIILEGERRRGQVGKRASEMMGLDSLFNWITGTEGANNEER